MIFISSLFQTVWSSGVDPRVVEVKRCDLEPTGWQLRHVNHLSARDVHAMTYVKSPGHTSEGIVFAGDDTRLYLTCVSKRGDVERGLRRLSVTRNSKLPLAPVSTLCKLFMHWFDGGYESRFELERFFYLCVDSPLYRSHGR